MTGKQEEEYELTDDEFKRKRLAQLMNVLVQIDLEQKRKNTTE